jgi:transcriptional antiterminator NusG
LSEDEIAYLAGPETAVEIDYEVGDAVNVISGVWEGTTGLIAAINESKQSVTIHVDMFGRETPVELGFEEVKKV